MCSKLHTFLCVSRRFAKLHIADLRCVACYTSHLSRVLHVTAPSLRSILPGASWGLVGHPGASYVVIIIVIITTTIIIVVVVVVAVAVAAIITIVIFIILGKFFFGGF